MKKNIVCIAIVIVLTASLFFNSSCENSQELGSTNNLIYYTANADSDFCALIKKYNTYCLKKYDKSYQIEIVEFKTEDEMCIKLSTELMAGGGPDIVSTDEKLPFEKLMQSNMFLDINTLIEADTSDTKIDPDDYNSVVMNVGMYGGKLYVLPLFYCADILVTTRERLNKFGVDCTNGEALTYSLISEKFSDFFDMESLGFVANNAERMQLFNRFVASYADFTNNTVYFNTAEFKNNAEIMRRMVNASSGDSISGLFNDLYIGYSFPLIVGKYSYCISEGETPLVCRGLVKDENTYSAFVEMGFAINANTDLREKAYAFAKYALSDEVQMALCGANGTDYFANITFPVNKIAYEAAKQAAAKRTDDNGNVIGIGNDFMKAYINIADNVTNCSLYADVSNSYYNSSVIGEIIDKYLNGDISTDKFVLRLTDASQIYLDE